LNPQRIFLSRKYALLFHFFGKSFVNPNPCAIISPPGEKCGLETGQKKTRLRLITKAGAVAFAASNARFRLAYQHVNTSGGVLK
jgi:hypothetical protein